MSIDEIIKKAIFAIIIAALFVIAIIIEYKKAMFWLSL